MQADQDVVGQGDRLPGPTAGQEKSSRVIMITFTPRGCDHKLFGKIILLSFIMKCQLYVQIVFLLSFQ